MKRSPFNEDIISGPGCSEAAGYERVGVSDTGVTLWKRSRCTREDAVDPDDDDDDPLFRKYMDAEKVVSGKRRRRRARPGDPVAAELARRMLDAFTGKAPAKKFLNGTTEKGMDSINKAIADALVIKKGDKRDVRDHKAILKRALETGKISTKRVAAEMLVEALAKAAHEADPSKSFEKHYVAQLMSPENKDIARLLQDD